MLTVCTGILPALQSGIIAGKRATAPRGVLPMLKKLAPDVEWVDKRWTSSEDGKLWSSGGVTNGTDMMAAFLRETSVVAPEVVGLVCALTDVGDRAQDYPVPLEQALAAFPSSA